MKLFPKSFERRRLFEKRQHPKTFLVFYQLLVFKHRSRGREQAPCRGWVISGAAQGWRRRIPHVRPLAFRRGWPSPIP
ncbi:hypothetical protein F1645_08740 [Novacetimonas hansenii]